MIILNEAPKLNGQYGKKKGTTQHRSLPTIVHRSISFSNDGSIGHLNGCFLLQFHLIGISGEISRISLQVG